jgi:hypothetical protein
MTACVLIVIAIVTAWNWHQQLKVASSSSFQSLTAAAIAI